MQVAARGEKLDSACVCGEHGSPIPTAEILPLAEESARVTQDVKRKIAGPRSPGPEPSISRVPPRRPTYVRAVVCRMHELGAGQTCYTFTSPIGPLDCHTEASSPRVLCRSSLYASAVYADQIFSRLVGSSISAIRTPPHSFEAEGKPSACFLVSSALRLLLCSIVLVHNASPIKTTLRILPHRHTLESEGHLPERNAINACKYT